MPGYPDWQRVNTRVQDALFYNAALLMTTPHTLGPYPVANLERVLFVVELSGTGSYQVTVVWYNDAGVLQATAQSDIVVDGNARVWAQSLPVQGRYMQVFTQALVTHAGDTALVSIVPNSNPVTIQEQDVNLLITENGVSIPAATTSTFESTVVTPGPALLHIFSVATTWFVDVQYTDLTGVWQTAYQWTFTTASSTLNQQIVLPSAPVRLQVHNSDAAAHPFIITLAASSF